MNQKVIYSTVHSAFFMVTFKLLNLAKHEAVYSHTIHITNIHLYVHILSTSNVSVQALSDKVQGCKRKDRSGK